MRAEEACKITNSVLHEQIESMNVDKYINLIKDYAEKCLYAVTFSNISDREIDKLKLLGYTIKCNFMETA